MGNTKKDTGSSIVVNVQDAKAAYEALKPTLDALPNDRLITPRVDAQRAAVHAFGLVERDRAESRARAFEALAKAKIGDVPIIAPDPLSRYGQAALATWYARQQQLRFAAHGGGTVPVAIADDSAQVKRRMLKVLEHYFGDHARFSLDIAAIRAGQGHQDTANDLQQVADLYEEPEIAETIAKDPVHYRDTDVRDARALAGEIFRALGFETRDSAEWAGRAQRAYTYLTLTYAEHCHAGGLLFFRSEDVSATYPPSLISVVRQPRGRSGQEAVVDDTTGGPAGDPNAGPVTPA